ncbi:MAG: hypothetical protein J0H42_05970 [Rhizobiales bacterium]|nr:hypothetical protein [Hyphomicrobiales bacterium]
MTKHAAHELANQQTELTANEMEYVSGGSVSVHTEQVVVHYQHPVTSTGKTMFRPPSKKRA